MTGNTSATIKTVIDTVLTTMQSLVWLLAGTAILVFMWGMVLYVWNSADSKGHQDGKQLIMWGLTAIFVIFSLASILSLMCLSVFGSASCHG